MTGDRRLKLRKTFFITKTTLLNDCIHYIFSSYDLKVFCSLIIKSSFIQYKDTGIQKGWIRSDFMKQNADFQEGISQP